MVIHCPKYDVELGLPDDAAKKIVEAKACPGDEAMRTVLEMTVCGG